jgi:hypothetical protein
MTGDDWVRNFWLPLLVLFVAAVSSAVSAKVRVIFWKPLGRALRVLVSLRLITSANRTQAANKVGGLEREIARLEGLMTTTEIEAERRLSAVHGEADRMVELARTDVSSQVEQAMAIGQARGIAAMRIEIALQRAVPHPEPAWRVIQRPADGAFELKNVQPGVVVQDVSIQAPLEAFGFNGPTQWPGKFENSLVFDGQRMRQGRLSGVVFSLKWRDLNGDWQAGEAWIEKERRTATVF